MFTEENYFSSYSFTDIHRTMIEDDKRTGVYHRAIMQNKFFFKNKIVLDIGCGSGILSFFAVRAGASRVIAFDNSSIIKKAEIIAKENNINNVIFINSTVEDFLIASLFHFVEKFPLELFDLSNNSENSETIETKLNEIRNKIKEKQNNLIKEISSISLSKKQIFSSEKSLKNHLDKILPYFLKIEDKMKEISKLLFNPADVIISEWMGYGLLAERMLPTVILARDFLLKPCYSTSSEIFNSNLRKKIKNSNDSMGELEYGREIERGRIFPSKASLYIAGFENWNFFNSEKNWADYVWGFNFSALTRKENEIEDFNKELNDSNKCESKMNTKKPLPIIDCFKSWSINSEVLKIKEFDIRTMKIEDLNFKKEFFMRFYPKKNNYYYNNITKVEKFDREEEEFYRDKNFGFYEDNSYKPHKRRGGPVYENNKYLHGFCLWFDVEFSDGHKNLILDTSPFGNETHWAQTIYLFDEEGLIFKPDIGKDIISDEVRMEKEKINDKEEERINKRNGIFKVSFENKNSLENDRNVEQKIKIELEKQCLEKEFLL